MKQVKKTERMKQIEEAAYALIHDKGYAGTSMLNIAKHAKASNETLYNWYGDKLGLFKAMVESNARRVRDVLQSAIKREANPLETLDHFGSILLEVLTGDRAIALNRAAAADPSGKLGRALANAGRNSVAPLIGEVLERARQSGLLTFENTRAATELYLGLLIGDVQLRCVTSQIDAPDRAARKERARKATSQLQQLLG